MTFQPPLAKPRMYMLREPIKVNFQNQNRNQGNNHPQGNNQGRNQFFQGASHGPNLPPAYQALAYQASGYQALVHQPSIPQPQVVTTTEFTNYMMANDSILKNMQTNMTSLINSNLEVKNMFGQFMKMNTTLSLGLGTLPSNTITNPKEDVKGITTRSGIAYQEPMIPTFSSLSQVVERETKVTKDTVPPTNNGSTKDVQPPVVQIETLIPNSEPVISLVVEPVVAPVSAPKPNQKPSIQYPPILHDQKLCDKANDQKEKFYQIFQDLNFNISFADALILMPKFGPTIKEVDAFLTLEDDSTSLEVDHSYYDTEGDILLLEAFINDDPSLPPPTQGMYLPQEKSHFMVKEGIVLGHKMSKNGTKFTKVMLKYGVTHLLATAYHPPTNRKVEVSNRDLKESWKGRWAKIVPHGKLKTRWSAPFTITQVFPYGNVDLSQTDKPNFKVIKDDGWLRVHEDGLAWFKFELIFFADALLLMPKFASTIKSFLTNKDKLFELSKISLNENFSAMLLKKLLVKKKLSLPELTPTRMTIELADRSITRPKGVAEDVFVKVGKFHFSTNFVVMDFEADPRVPLSLGRSFLRTGRALIDVYGEEITLREILGFSNNSSGGNTTSTFEPILFYSSPSFTPFEGSDFILEEIKAYLKDESISLEIDHADYDLTGDICLIEKFLNNDPFQLPSIDLKQGEVVKKKSSIEEPPELELKNLPSHLEYAYLEDVDKLPMIIAKDLKDNEKEALLKVLKSHKKEIAWKITNIKGIDPRFCTHKILMEEDDKPAVQRQRRVNLKTHKVFKKEVIKLLDPEMIYPSVGKLKTRWSAPFTITQVFPYGNVDLSQTDKPNFKVNGHRLKHYFGEDIPKMVVLDFQTFPKDQ
nr:reverse transcriptase domain-containing protein [Tanacetum cinerariifolium]